MVEFLIKLLLVARSKLKSRARLEAENIVLRQQVIVLSRTARSRVRLRNTDRLILCARYLNTPELKARALTVAQEICELRWASISELYRSEVLGERELLPSGISRLASNDEEGRLNDRSTVTQFQPYCSGSRPSKRSRGR